MGLPYSQLMLTFCMNLKLTILFLLSTPVSRQTAEVARSDHGCITDPLKTTSKISPKSKVGVGFSSVSVADGRVYTMGHDGKKSDGMETVYCLDAKTGKMVWTHSYPAPLIDYLHEGGPCSTPTVDGSTVYALSKHGILHAYGAEDGKILWKKEMMKRADSEWGFAASPYLWEPSHH